MQCKVIFFGCSLLFADGFKRLLGIYGDIESPLEFDPVNSIPKIDLFAKITVIWC